MYEQKITPLMQAQPNAKATRTYRSQAEWEQLIAAWEQSGQSQKAFCESKRLCYRNFSQWKSRLKKNMKENQADLASFIPIQVTKKEASAASGVSAVTVHLANDVKLSLEGDVKAVAALIKDLSASLC